MMAGTRLADLGRWRRHDNVEAKLSAAPRVILRFERMAFITVSAEAGCRAEEAGRAAAHLLGFAFLGEPQIEELMAAEFGGPVPDKAWSFALTSIAARLGLDHHLIICTADSEYLLPKISGVMRVRLIAPDAHRAGNIMLDRRSDRAGARGMLASLEASDRARRKSRFGRAAAETHRFDLILNAAAFPTEAIASVIQSAALAAGLDICGHLTATAEAHLQFQVRLQLARYGIVPAGKAALTRKRFSHPSEQMFANLLDFYRISWEYEPRSFPLQWDKDGKVTEAFTPDFYLLEFDLYVELTTMKQSLVTRKNHKVKLLKAIYPHINIQVFYQRDFQDLVFKYGLEGRQVETNVIT